MLDFVPNVFFDVVFVGIDIGMSGQFVSVTGLGMEFEYETYTEGGANYPRHFFKRAVPQTLILEQGTVTTIDSFATWMNAINMGVASFLNGVVMLKDHTGTCKRTWTIQDAYPVKYIGPSLNSMTPELAVSRIELLHNGCI